MKSFVRKHKASLICAVVTFFIMTYYFMFVHPIIIFDTDDWLYAFDLRRPWPVWGGWNPIKVLPEMLQSMASYTVGLLIYPLTGRYIEAYTFVNSIVVSLFIATYIYAFTEVIRNGRHTVTTIYIGGVFLLLHFVVFRSHESNNAHLFYSQNMTCYYNYVIPGLLNAILVMLLLWDDSLLDANSSSSGKSKIRRFLFYIACYFAIFSNLFLSVILVAYIGASLIILFYRDISSKSFSIVSFVKKNIIRVLIIIAWLISHLYEANGGRAGQIANKFTVQGILEALITLSDNLKSINITFVVTTVVVLIGVILISIKHRDKIFLHYKSQVLILSMILSTSYLVLLCSVTGPKYIGSINVIFGICFFTLLIIIKCGLYILEKNRIGRCIFVVSSVLLLLNVNTKGMTFKDSHLGGENVSNETIIQIDYAIINQIKNAADFGEKEITLYVPDYKTYDNFPLANYGGNRFSSALYRHKITPYMVSVTEVVPIDDFYERFGVYDTM